MLDSLSTSARERWVSLQRSLGLRLSRRLFDEISKQPIPIGEARVARPSSWSLRFAYLLATCVYLSSAAWGVAGIWLLSRSWTTVLEPLLGLILLLLCIAARPRLGESPDYLLDAAQYPVLHRLSERIAHALGTQPVDGIAVSADFNANYRTVGWRQRRYIELGSPLLAILIPSERVALIAHELSHGANGDPLRGQFLLGAVNTVLSWASATRPTAIGRLGDGMPFGPIVSLIGIPFDFLMLGFSELLFWLARGFLLLELRESQRAEYLADLLAARVAGSAAMQRMLEKTYLADRIDAELRSHALTRPDEPMGGRLFEAASSLSEADWAQYHQASLAENWQVDATHPPTAYRFEMLAKQALQPPMSLLSEEEQAALALEMDRLVAGMQQELVNRKLEAIYG